MYGLFQTVFYFGYMGVLSMGLGIVCGTFGYAGTYQRLSLDWLIDWLIGRSIIDWLIDWLIDRSIIDWLIDWLIDWSFHYWLIDWLTVENIN